MDQQTALTGIQWATWFLYVFVIGAIVLYESKRKTNLSGIPFLVVGLHGVLFYSLLQLRLTTGVLPPWHEWMNFTVWSSVLRMHGALTILFVFGFETYEQVRFKKLTRRVKRYVVD
jgi:hypothetical protein